jgi:hypothetical protein
MDFGIEFQYEPVVLTQEVIDLAGEDFNSAVDMLEEEVAAAAKDSNIDL